MKLTTRTSPHHPSCLHHHRTTFSVLPYIQPELHTRAVASSSPPYPLVPTLPPPKPREAPCLEKRAHTHTYSETHISGPFSIWSPLKHADSSHFPHSQMGHTTDGPSPSSGLPPTARILSTWSLALSILETTHAHTYIHTRAHILTRPLPIFLLGDKGYVGPTPCPTTA